MKKYTTLFFDLDNTLLDFDKAENRAIRRVLEMHQLPHGDREAAIYSAINKTFWEAFERGEIERGEIFAGRFYRLLQTQNWQADAEKMAQDYFHCLAEGHDKVAGAEEILAFAHKKGYHVYATTNGISLTQHKRIRESGLEPLFDGVFISEDAGVQKPEKAYFDYVIANTPEQERTKILVIGDSQTSDILGGIHAGIDTCWFNPKGQPLKFASQYEIKQLDELKKILT